MNPLKHLLLFGCSAALLAGCTSAPSRFFTLDATATAPAADASSAAPAAKYSVIVGPVFIPATVDRLQVVITPAPNRVEIEEFNRWAAPLNESIARVVSLDLASLLSAPVATAPMPEFGPAYHVTLKVQRFESTLAQGNQGGNALIDLIWALRGPDGQNITSGHSLVTEPFSSSDFAGLAAAHSRALAKISADIASAIQSAAR